jgi:hypothetical protein
MAGHGRDLAQVNRAFFLRSIIEIIVRFPFSCLCKGVFD